MRGGGIELHHQRTDLGAQEVVGARRSKTCKFFKLVGIDELQYGIAVIEMTDLAFTGINKAANAWHQS